VSGDPTKRRELGRKYGVRAYSYEQYEECLNNVDAVYIALPNSMHAEYTIRAAEAGVHVLCEKPMAVTAGECEAMIDACTARSVKLMIAYRLHFEEATLKVIDLVRRGRIGEPKYFNSSFSLTVREGDIRTKPSMGGGSVYDIGIYCINAARHVFGVEPKEVVAVSVNSGAKRTKQIDESTGALLRFEGERLGAFVTSFNSADAGDYRIVGTKGSIHVDPAYEYAEGLRYSVTIGGKTTQHRSSKRDQFGAELVYFSDCIRKNRAPEPGGLEGLQDVRIIEAIYESADTGKPIELPPYKPPKQPTRAQTITRPGIKEPETVHAPNTSE
jgi:glucose-fructose oxidoreductase